MRVSTSRTPSSTAHMMADHGGYGNRESVSKNSRGIDKGAMQGIYRGIVVMSNITEVSVGMVEVVTQINATQ